MFNLLFFILILIIPAFGYIQFYLCYKKCEQCKTKNNMTGQEVAAEILKENSLEDIYVVETEGLLTDHYDSTRKVVRLSSLVYDGVNAASMSVAAHEASFALLDKEKNLYFKMRSKVYSLINLLPHFTYIILLVGFAFEIFNLYEVSAAITLIGLILCLIVFLSEKDANKKTVAQINNIIKPSKKEKECIISMISSINVLHIMSIAAILVNIIRIL